MKLTHYSSAPFVFDPARQYDAHEGTGFKPDGLWLSVDGPQDWPAWCRSADFALASLAHAADVVLRPDANILVLSTVAQLHKFTRRYSGASREPALAALLPGRFIDWRAVKAAHDGIIIAPYQWRARLALVWYYPWDCASGCVWNLRAVESVTPRITGDTK